MPNETITLLVPNYNNGPYLAECLDSLLAQTCERWRCIILDDASTDASAEIYPRYAGDPRIRVEHNPENLGLIGSLRRLISMAETDLIGLLDPDDALVSHAIETMLEAHESHQDAGFIYSNFMYCDETLERLRPGFSRPIPPGRTSLDVDCISHFKTFRKSVYERTEGYDEAILYAEDKDLVLKMEEAAPVHFVDAELYRYRLLASSQSHGPKRAIGKSNFALARRNARRRRAAAGLPMSPKQRLLRVLDGLLHRD